MTVDAEPAGHGGDLATARRLFPDAPAPFLDLSTGINPHPYPLPALAPDIFARLPQPDALGRLAAAAAKAYGAPSAQHVVPAPGTQSLFAHVAALVPPGRAMILGPAYAEHARAAPLAGHEAVEVGDVGRLAGADLAIVVNPNNPDGRLLARDALTDLADRLAPRGLLVVDEAFMDVAASGASLAAEVPRGNIVVLRSFGKFFGLAGVRLGFALAAPPLAARLRAALGPWAVSGPAIAVGTVALADEPWIEASRAQLAQAAQRLDALLARAGLAVIGGTALFRLVRTQRATEVFERLGRTGVLVRRFAENPAWLRFGLPGAEPEWERLERALSRETGA